MSFEPPHPKHLRPYAANSANKRPPIGGLDWIKIIATILIGFHHYQQRNQLILSPITFWKGSFGFGLLVEVFFMTSGFLALYTHRPVTSSERSAHPYLKRLCHKLLRIYPMATLALIATILFGYATGDVTPEQLSVPSLLANVTLTFSGYVAVAPLGINNPTWYLCTLIQCYVVFHGQLYVRDRLGERKGTSWMVATCAGLATLAATIFLKRLWSAHLCRGVECFYMGVLLCMSAEHLRNKGFWKERRARMVALVCAGLACTLAVFAVRAADPSSTTTSVQRSILVFGVYPLLIMLSYATSQLRRGSSPVRRLAGVAFNAYLWHYPLALLGKLVSSVCAIDFAPGYAGMVLSTLFVWGVAYLLYRYVETPLALWLKRFGY